MTTLSATDNDFDDRLLGAWKLYNKEEFWECEEPLRDLIKDPAIPRYHRLKTLAMLASVVDDSAEANQFRLTAEALWDMVRDDHPVGSNQRVDRRLAGLRGELDGIKEALALEEVSETVEQLAARLEGIVISIGAGEEPDDEDRNGTWRN